ncbi:MAG: hypothetical protein K6G51_05725 [Sphaerochaetaceae bacterium]|nr:hypothetical protein [Sphaerochaetaceae bacterium]
MKKFALLLLLLIVFSSLLFSAIQIPEEEDTALREAVNKLYFPLSGDELYCNILSYEDLGEIARVKLSLSGRERFLVYEKGKNVEKNIFNAVRDILLYNPDFEMEAPRLDYITSRERSTVSLEGKVSNGSRFTLVNLEGNPIALYDVSYIVDDAVILQPVWIKSEMTGLHLKRTIPLEISALARLGKNEVSTFGATVSYNIPIMRMKALFRIDSKNQAMYAGLGMTLSLSTLTQTRFTLFQDGRLNASCFIGFEDFSSFTLKGGFSICYEHFINNHIFWGVGFENMATKNLNSYGAVLKVGYAL